MTEEYMSLYEFSKQSGIPYSTVIKYTTEDRIRSIKSGHSHLVFSSELDRLDEIGHPPTSAARQLEKKVLSPNEASKLLKISAQTILNMCKADEIEHVTMNGGRSYIPEHVVYEWLFYREPTVAGKYCHDNKAMFVEEVAEMSKRSVQMIRVDTHSGKLPAVKIKDRMCVLFDDAVEYTAKFF